MMGKALLLWDAWTGWLAAGACWQAVLPSQPVFMGIRRLHDADTAHAANCCMMTGCTLQQLVFHGVWHDPWLTCATHAMQ